MDNETMNNNNHAEVTAKSSTGLDENMAALFSYIFGFVTGIIFFVIEKESKFVKFHAMQSILVTVALMVINFILGLIPVIGWILAIVIAPVSLVLWVVLMVKAYKHTWFKLPVIGEIAEKQASLIKL